MLAAKARNEELIRAFLPQEHGMRNKREETAYQILRSLRDPVEERVKALFDDYSDEGRRLYTS